MRYLYLIILLGWHPAAKAQNIDVSNIDAILDRLEQKLLDQESGPVTYDEKNSPGKNETDNMNQKKNFQPLVVEGINKNSERLKEIKADLSELENEIDILTTNVQKTKQNILDDAAINNFVTLDLSLSENEKATLKSVKIRLDGFSLYEIDDSSGLWLPAAAIPLFSGPMQVGQHRLDLEVRIAMREIKSIPVNASVYKVLQKSFEWSIPANQTKMQYKILISPPRTIENQPDAKLEEVF